MSAAVAEKPIRVVIVDDTPDLRDLLRLARESDGFDVVAEAGDGQEGIDVARAQRPDVILLDLSMPVMDGLEALPTLRKVCPEAKIIVLSGFGAAQMTRRALAAGADGYLQKGVALKTILGYVRDLTDETTRPPARSVRLTPPVTLARPQAVAASPDGPDAAGTGLPTSSLADAVRLAPYGVIELVDEPVYRIVSANDTAVELLGRPCPAGAPLFSTTPALASMMTLHRTESRVSFQVELPERRVSATLRRTGTSVLLYLVPADEVMRRQIASTAHELRGPATVIIGLVEGLVEAGADDPEQLRILDRIHHQARLLDSVASDLLTDAQAHRGQLRVTLRELDPLTALRPLLADLEGAVLEIDDDRLLLADPHRFEQMVGNLLANAQRYGRPPYSVRVRPAADPRSVCIDVVDHGPGVPADFVDRLFQEFARVEGSLDHGTGLGLYVVRTLATAHGGAVGYAPAPGGGSVFTLTLAAKPR